MIRSLFFSSLGFVAALLPASAAVPLVNLVNDQTLVVVSITDTPALLRGLESSPLYAAWNDPQIMRFLAPLREEMEVDTWDNQTRDATGLTIRELLGLAGGEALFALPTLDLAKMKSSDAPPPVLVALQVGDNAAKIEKLLADSAEKKNLKVETEMFSGVKVTLNPLSAKDADGDDDDAKPATVAWAIVEGVWVLGMDKERVFSAIDAIKHGGVESALGKSERFLRVRERSGDAQLITYINMPAAYPLIRDAVVAAKAKKTGAPNPMGVDGEAIFNALGLDAFGSLFVSMQTNETETRFKSGLFYSDERGLLKLMAYQPGPAAQPDWVPAKWPSVSSMRFSIVKAYAGLEQVLEELSPMIAGMAQGQIRGFNKKLGLDLKRDLIGSLGDDIISAYALPAGGDVPSWDQMDQLLAFSLTDEATFVRAVDALKKLGGPALDQLLVKRDYLGHALYTFTPPPSVPGAKPSRGFSYAIANRTLLLGVGTPATVESALQGMASNQGLFWKRDDVQAALADLPADASAIQVQDLRVLAKSILEMAVTLEKAAQANASDDKKSRRLDLSARPDDEDIARYFGTSASSVVRTAEGLFSEGRIVHPKQ